MLKNIDQFIRLRGTLRERKRQLEQELQELEAALGEDQQSPSTPVKSSPPTIARRGRPAQGGQSLKSVVLQVLQDGPMTKEDILEAVQRAGYTFNSAKPANSLGVILYGKNPRFDRVDGKFVLPGGGKKSGSNAGSNPSTKPKRTMSPAARKRIAEAARKRWAAARAAGKSRL